MISQINGRRWWLAGALVAVLLAAACGGSKMASTGEKASSSDTSGPTMGDKALVGLSERAMPDGRNVAGAPQSGAGADGAVTGGDANPAQLPSQLDRKIIQTATLDITVDAVSRNFEDVGNVAVGLGGFVASSQFGNEGDRQTASITIRVPGDKYQDALVQLRKLGEVQGEQSGANDVTEEYTDLQSRLKNLQSIEAQYVELLQRAENINEVLTVQDRLNATRGEIEQVQGRINLLDHQTELATITVHLAPPIAAATGPSDSGSDSPLDVAADSFQASLAVLLGIATVALAVAAFSWWLVPVAIVALAIARRQLHAMDARRASPPPMG